MVIGTIQIRHNNNCRADKERSENNENRYLLY